MKKSFSSTIWYPKIQFINRFSLLDSLYLLVFKITNWSPTFSGYDRWIFVNDYPPHLKDIWYFNPWQLLNLRSIVPSLASGSLSWFVYDFDLFVISILCHRLEISHFPRSLENNVKSNSLGVRHCYLLIAKDNNFLLMGWWLLTLGFIRLKNF